MRKKRKWIADNALPENLEAKVNIVVILLWLITIVLIPLIIFFSQIGLRTIVDFATSEQWDTLRVINLLIYAIYSLIAVLGTSIILLRLSSTRKSEKKIRSSKIVFVTVQQVVMLMIALALLGVAVFIFSGGILWGRFILFHFLRLGIISAINIAMTVIAMTEGKGFSIASRSRKKKERVQI